MTHTLSTLPKEFSQCIASLNGCELVENVMVAFSNVESMIKKAEKYVWISSNQVLVSTLPYLQEAVKRGVEFRLMLPIGVSPPKDTVERMLDPIFLQTLKTGKFENRLLDKVNVLICISEKKVAALGFLSLDGKMDYHGFHSEDELSFKWTKALFSHYWNLATRQAPGFPVP